jgi:hypothetical protein
MEPMGRGPCVFSAPTSISRTPPLMLFGAAGRPSSLIQTRSIPQTWRLLRVSAACFGGRCSALLRRMLFWVNPPDGAALAGSKILQLEMARTIGLTIPETLFTNSPTEIRQFLGRGRQVIYKSLSGGGWMNNDSRFLSYTSLLSEDDLVADRVLRQTPGIFQDFVPKSHELRVTVMGNHVLAARVLSQETQRGRLDWRQSYDELQFSPDRLPSSVEGQCRALLDALGLVFGCFDFIVTPEGEHVFLEVNEMGQFLFIERYCGLPLLDAFSEFLFQGRVDFDWNTDSVQLRYGDPEFERAALARWTAFQSSHRLVPESLFDES